MKAGKIIGLAALGDLVLSLIPYKFTRDTETGKLVEVRSLLWGYKITPGGKDQEKDRFSFAMPASKLDEVDANNAGLSGDHISE
ncbi:MAG: hypothetical protein IJU57_04420 [Clostridia bacterium]|nr:hypothetical protein [Clostridia bacterium]